MTTSVPVYGPSAERESEASVMAGTKSQAIAEYGVRAREPLPPNESAPVPFRVSRAGRIVDVVGLPPNVAVVRASLGRVRYSREEMKTSFAEFLALEPQEVKVGTYCVFTMMNLGTKPVQVAGNVIVEGEHGEVVEGLPLREATADDDNERPVYGRGAAASEASVSSVNAARRNPANDAMVDAIIDNATMADGTPITKAKPSKSKSSKSSKPATGRRPSPTPMTAPLPRAREMKPQKIMTRHARRQRYDAQEAAKLVAGGETRVVLLHVGNVAMLDLSLSARIPLGEDVRGEISAALHEAREDATPEGVGVVAIRLAEDDCLRLAEAIDARAEYTLEDTEAMCAAVKQALGPKATSVSVHGPSAERDERGASLEPEAEASVPSEAETSAPVENTEVGNVTPISTSVSRSGEKRGDSLGSNGKVQDDGRPQTTSVPVYGPSEASARR